MTVRHDVCWFRFQAIVKWIDCDLVGEPSQTDHIGVFFEVFGGWGPGYIHADQILSNSHRSAIAHCEALKRSTSDQPQK